MDTKISNYNTSGNSDTSIKNSLKNEAGAPALCAFNYGPGVRPLLKPTNYGSSNAIAARRSFFARMAFWKKNGGKLMPSMRKSVDEIFEARVEQAKQARLRARRQKKVTVGQKFENGFKIMLMFVVVLFGYYGVQCAISGDLRDISFAFRRHLAGKDVVAAYKEAYELCKKNEQQFSCYDQGKTDLLSGLNNLFSKANKIEPDGEKFIMTKDKHYEITNSGFTVTFATGGNGNYAQKWGLHYAEKISKKRHNKNINKAPLKHIDLNTSQIDGKDFKTLSGEIKTVTLERTTKDAKLTIVNNNGQVETFGVESWYFSPPEEKVSFSAAELLEYDYVKLVIGN